VSTIRCDGADLVPGAVAARVAVPTASDRARRAAAGVEVGERHRRVVWVVGVDQGCGVVEGQRPGRHAVMLDDKVGIARRDRPPLVGPGVDAGVAGQVAGPAERRL